MEKLTSINLKSIASKINEMIEVVLCNSRKLDNEELEKRVKALEDKPHYTYNDREILERIKALEDKPAYTYDDKTVKERIKALEDKPAPKQKEFDDSEIILAIDEIRNNMESLDRRIDFIRRTYSEKWQHSEFERVKFQKEIRERISKIEAIKADKSEL